MDDYRPGGPVVVMLATGQLLGIWFMVARWRFPVVVLCTGRWWGKWPTPVVMAGLV